MPDYLVVCDASGFVCKKSETRKMWDGKIVRKDFWEPRHPQDFLPSIKESIPKEVRMDQEDPPLLSDWYYDLYLYYDELRSYEDPIAYTYGIGFVDGSIYDDFAVYDDSVIYDYQPAVTEYTTAFTPDMII